MILGMFKGKMRVIRELKIDTSEGYGLEAEVSELGALFLFALVLEPLRLHLLHFRVVHVRATGNCRLSVHSLELNKRTSTRVGGVGGAAREFGSARRRRRCGATSRPGARLRAARAATAARAAPTDSARARPAATRHALSTRHAPHLARLAHFTH